jgi:predicted nucleic acid-binding Zn ribbon protein
MARRLTARARRKQLAPEPTATLVDSTLRHLRLDETVKGMRAMRAFEEVAGSRIRARARAERLRGQTLFVRVASSAWSQELHVLSAAILERLRALPGGEGITELRFHVRDVEALPAWQDPEPQAPPARRGHPSVPPDLRGALAAIVDPELRERFAALLGRATVPPRR